MNPDRNAALPERNDSHTRDIDQLPTASRLRCVIERIDAEAKTAGGITIPDTAQEKPQQGKVIAAGPGGRDESGKLIRIDVKVGDRAGAQISAGRSQQSDAHLARKEALRGRQARKPRAGSFLRS